MPSRTELYVQVEDNRREGTRMRKPKLVPIRFDRGHRAGMPAFNPADASFIDEALNSLLAEPGTVAA